MERKGFSERVARLVAKHGASALLATLAQRGERNERGCLIWTRARSAQGYGYIQIDGDDYRVHRLALAIFCGDMRDEEFALHTCDDRACFELTHLQRGDHPENMRQMVERGRAATGDRNAARLYPESRRRGQEHPSAKLNSEAVAAIRQRRGERQRDLAREFGVCQRTIQKVVNGVSYV